MSSWKAKAEALQATNARLKQEAAKREDQLKEIKRQFKAIVEELQKRELPDGVSSGSSKGRDMDTEAFIKLQEIKIKELTAKCNKAQKAQAAAQGTSQKWEQQYTQLKQSRRRLRDPSADEWKAKYEALKEETVRAQRGRIGQPGSSVQATTVQAIRALRPRRAFEEPPEEQPRTTGNAATSPMSLSLAKSPRSPRPALVHAEGTSFRQEEQNVQQVPVQTPAQSPIQAFPAQESMSLRQQIDEQILRALQTTEGSERTKALIDSLRKENLSLQRTVENILDEKAALEKELSLVVHERDMLASRRAEAAYMKSDVVDLQRELVEKNAKLVLLDSRVKQAQQAAESMKVSQTELIQELERLNNSLVSANERALEAENALQVARVGMGRVEGLDERIKARDEEVRLLNQEVNRLMQKCHTTRDEVTNELREEWERQLEEKQKQLEDSERNNKQLFRNVQLATEQRDEMHTNWVKVQKERDTLDTEAITLRGRNEALEERVKLFGPGAQVDQEEDVHKALALIQHHKRKGDPTDLEFLMKAWDTPGTELSDLRAENTALLRELEVAKKALQLRDQRMEAQAEKMLGLKHATEGKDALIENMGDKVRRLTNELADYRGVGKKLSTDSDASSVVAGENENVLEVCLSHLTVDRFDGDPSFCTFCLSFDFLDFETCATETLTGRSVTFSKTFCFTVEVSNALRHYIQHKTIDIELLLVDGVKFESIAKGTLSLKELLSPACCFAQGHVGLMDSESRVATVEYGLRLQRALPHDWGSYPALPVVESMDTALIYTFRHIKALKVSIHECRGLSAADPVPYVLVTPTSTVITDKVYLGDLTADMPHPQRTRDPVFHFTHEYPLSIDPYTVPYIRGALLNFIVLDDSALDPKLSTIGRASVALSPLLESTGSTVNAVLELNDAANKVAGTIVVELRWVKQANALPVYVEGL